MRVVGKRELYVAIRNEDNSYNEPQMVYGAFGDISPKVLSSISVDSNTLEIGKVKKILNLSIADDNYNEQDRVYLELPLVTDVLGKRADYEILGAMRGMFHVTYLLGKR